MRKTFWATAAVIGFAAVANAAPPSMHTSATVLGVDRGDKSFTTRSGFGSSKFQTTNHTMFRAGTAPTNWGAVKTGSKVGITYHLEGRSQVADEVVIGG
jgi:hypothetical protein